MMSVLFFQMADLAVLEEVLRMVLEIINSCLAASLHHNPHLVYSLLYQRELFNSFKTHPTFQDILQNIDIVRERERVSTVHSLDRDIKLVHRIYPFMLSFVVNIKIKAATIKLVYVEALYKFEFIKVL